MHITAANDINAGGSLVCKNDITSSNGTCHARNGFRASNGSLWVSNDIESNTGFVKAKTKFKCDDKEGKTGEYGYTTDDGNRYQMKFKGGILYAVDRM
jgi:hypothetical protein